MKPHVSSQVGRVGRDRSVAVSKPVIPLIRITGYPYPNISREESLWSLASDDGFGEILFELY